MSTFKLSPWNTTTQEAPPSPRSTSPLLTPDDADSFLQPLLVGSSSTSSDDAGLAAASRRGRRTGILPRPDELPWLLRACSARVAGGVCCALVVLVVLWLVVAGVQLSRLKHVDVVAAGMIRADVFSPSALPFSLSLSLSSRSWFPVTIQAATLTIRTAAGTTLGVVPIPTTKIAHGTHAVSINSAFEVSDLDATAALASALASRALNASFPLPYTSLSLSAALTVYSPALFYIRIPVPLDRTIALDGSDTPSSVPPPPPTTWDLARIAIDGAGGGARVDSELTMPTPFGIRTPSLAFALAHPSAPLGTLTLDPSQFGGAPEPQSASFSVAVAGDARARAVVASLVATTLQPAYAGGSDVPLTLAGAPATDKDAFIRRLVARMRVVVPPPHPGTLGFTLPSVVNLGEYRSGASTPGALAGKIVSVALASPTPLSAAATFVVNTTAVVDAAFALTLSSAAGASGSVFVTPGTALPPMVVAAIPGGMAAAAARVDVAAEVADARTPELVTVTATVTAASALVAQALVLPSVPLWEVDDVPEHLFTNPLFALREYADAGASPLLGALLTAAADTGAGATVWSSLAAELAVACAVPPTAAALPWSAPGPPLVELLATDVAVSGRVLGGVATGAAALPSALAGVTVTAALPPLDADVVATRDEEKAPVLAAALHAHAPASTLVVSGASFSVTGGVTVASSPMAAAALSQWMSGDLLPVYGKLTPTPSGRLASLLQSILVGVRWRYTLGTTSTLYELQDLTVAPLGPSSRVDAVADLWLALEWLHLDVAIGALDDGIPVVLASSGEPVASLAWAPYTIASGAVNTISASVDVTDVDALGTAVAAVDLKFKLWPDPATAAESFVTALLAGVTIDAAAAGGASGASSLADLVQTIAFGGASPSAPLSAFRVTSGLEWTNTLVTATLPGLGVALHVTEPAAAAGQLLGIEVDPVVLAPGASALALGAAVTPTTNATLLRLLGSHLLAPVGPLAIRVELGVGGDNVVARVLAAASFDVVWAGGAVGSVGNVTYTVMGSDIDFVDLRMDIPISLPTALPDIELGLPSVTFAYAGATVGSVALNTNVLRGGGRTTAVVVEGVVSAETSRSALESLINTAAAGVDDVAVDAHVVLAPMAGAEGGTPFEVDYGFVFPARSPAGAPPAPPSPSGTPAGLNSVVECTELSSLDFGYFDILKLKCSFTAVVGIHVHNPSPLTVTVNHVEFDLRYDNPNGVCLYSVCYYDPAFDLLLTHVVDPTSASTVGQLPLTLVAGASGKTSLVLAPSSVEMCLRLGNEYERHQREFHVHVRNGRAVLHIENMVLNLEFELPDYVVRASDPSPSCV